MKRKRHTPNLDAARLRTAEAKAELAAYRTALGIDGHPHVQRLLLELGRLMDAADPTPGRNYDSTGASRSQFGQPAPGSASRAHRAALTRIMRQVVSLTDRAATALENPGWRPPRGGRCPSCRFQSRSPMAKHCDACGTALIREDEE